MRSPGNRRRLIEIIRTRLIGWNNKETRKDENQGIGFVGIPVTEMTKARAFYEDVLWFKTGSEMTGERWTEYPVGTGVIAMLASAVTGDI